jgi:hypothetical protein
LEAINPGSSPRIAVPNPEEARALAELILADSPELSVDVNVQSRGDGPNEIVTPDVGIISPIELYEASVQELNSCVQDGRRKKPLESHPDGYIDDPDDGNDAMFGRRFVDKREKRKDPVVEPVPYQPMLPPKPIDPKDQTVEVEFGVYGNWQTFTVPKTITEEEINALATSIYGPPIATPDFTASPYQTQQFRFFPDISHGAPIWITCRQTQGRTKHTLILRVSAETTHEEIEQACSQVWSQPMKFKGAPSVYDPNSIYWMMPKPSEDSPESEAETDSWPIPDDDGIPYVPTPTFKPMVCTFTRSLSSDDLSKPSPIPLAKRSPDVLTCRTVSFGLQHVRYWAPESASVDTVVQGAAAEIGIQTGIVGRRH